MDSTGDDASSSSVGLWGVSVSEERLQPHFFRNSELEVILLAAGCLRKRVCQAINLVVIGLVRIPNRAPGCISSPIR